MVINAPDLGIDQAKILSQFLFKMSHREVSSTEREIQIPISVNEYDTFVS